ncbi:SufE family protein [Sulfurivirga sp.]|uniref:SufE family protein n=1 Tax=Sulfurivirga sp. TaxID=2614236 RepID=UPI0025FEEC7A|nr:SufE family protein [Sulfurivirga sp.]
MELTPPDKSIEDVQRELVERFSRYDNWKDRYKLLIDMGKQLQAMPEEYRTEENRIHGCQSQVWLHVEEKDGRLYFQGMSDAAIVSGLVAMLLTVYNGRTPEEILKAPLDFLKEMGLLQHLSPNRANGLYHMIKRIQKAAKEALIRRIKAQQNAH